MALRRGKQRETGLVMQGDASAPPPPDDEPVAPRGDAGAGSTGADGRAHFGADGHPALPVATGRLGEILLEEGAIDEAQLKAALEMQSEEQEHVGLVRAWMAKVPQPDPDWDADPDPPRYTD